MPTYPLKGVNFTDQEFTPSSDCALWRNCCTDGQITGAESVVDGSTLTLTAGWIMAGGKQLCLDAPVSIPLTGLSNGFARLVVNIDLSETATETVFNQAWIEVQYAATEAAFPALTRGDLTASGTLYQCEYCRCVLSNGAISSVSVLAASRPKAQVITRDILPSYWTASGSKFLAVLYTRWMTPDATVLSSPAPEHQDYAADCRVKLRSQYLGRVVFEAVTKPTSTITWNIILL